MDELKLNYFDNEGNSLSETLEKIVLKKKLTAENIENTLRTHGILDEQFAFNTTNAFLNNKCIGKYIQFPGFGEFLCDKVTFQNKTVVLVFNNNDEEDLLDEENPFTLDQFTPSEIEENPNPLIVAKHYLNYLVDKRDFQILKSL